MCTSSPRRSICSRSTRRIGDFDWQSAARNALKSCSPSRCAADCQSKSPIRRVDRLQIERRGELVHIDIAANAFLHHMVRNIAGLLIEVGRGERSPEAVKTLLEGRDRRANAPTAAAEGLALRRIEYPAAFRLPDPVYS